MTKSRFTAQYDRFLTQLKALRTQKGLLQSELAEKLGVPQQYVSRFETGETRMDIVQLWEYCNALGISFTAFCKKMDREFGQPSESSSSRKRPRRR